jgi:hypothetical protein
MLTEIKPYDGGNYAIWPIHQLNIRDKHRLLIPVIFYSSISGIETQDDKGQIHPNGFTMGIDFQPPWYIPMPVGVHVKNNGKVSIGVMFEYADAGCEVRIMDSFMVYSGLISQVVETLESLV